MRRPEPIWLISLVLVGTAAWAQDAEQEVPEAPPPPEIREPLPPKVQDPDEQVEPRVVIRQEEGRTIEEYSMGGQVYMIRITPVSGPPYYLIDGDGDGEIDDRQDHMEPVKPAYWKIVDW